MIELVSESTNEAGVGKPKHKDFSGISPDLCVQVVNVLATTVATSALLVIKPEVENLIALDATYELNFGSPV